MDTNLPKNQGLDIEHINLRCLLDIQKKIPDTQLGTFTWSPKDRTELEIAIGSH